MSGGSCSPSVPGKPLFQQGASLCFDGVRQLTQSCDAASVLGSWCDSHCLGVHLSVFAFRAFLNFTDSEVDFSVSILVILGYFLRRKRAEIILLSNPFPKPS